DFPPAHEGGAGVIACNIAKGLFKKGEDILVFTTTKEKNEEGKSVYDGLKIVKVFSDYNERWRAYVSIYNYPVLKKLKEIITEFKPDIVHAHNIHIGISYGALKIAKKSKAKVFITMHDVMSFSYGKLRTKRYLETAVEGRPDCKVSFWDNLKMAKKRFNPFRNFLIRRYLKYADKIFAVSGALRDALKNNGIVGAEVIYNGIEVKNWEIDKNSVINFKRKFNLEDKKIILFGGRLSEGKGLKKIILAAEEMVKKNPELILLIIGKKELALEQMEKLLEQKSLTNKVIFTGWISGQDLKAAYWSSDIVCVPSLYLDPFPTINLEAMACRKPVVATCFGGSKEVVENGETGFIINPNKVSDIAEKIMELLENQEKAKEMGEIGFRRVLEKFSLDNQIEKLMIWYGKKV
ncbi:MAG: hypothetical protein A2604_00715, partial [Candidatus Liptonbacteria bacterium RIFOXYD1_FULL_36_11]